MDPYPHGIKHLKGFEWWKAVGTIWSFVGLLMFFWLVHILFIGWYQYFFKPKGYLIQVSNILEAIELPVNGRWWNRHHCDLARKVVELNDPNDYALFTWRCHPFFMGNDILYVRSNRLNARVWDEREKIYPNR